MIHMDYGKLKDYLTEKGIKQKTLARNTGIPEASMSLILQGKRKCETGEYAKICTELGTPLDAFISEEKEVV